MKKTMLLISMVIVVMLLVPLSGSAQQKVMTWTGQTISDPNTPSQKTIEKLCADITKASNGRLVLKVTTTGAIVPFGKEWDALRAKTLDFANVNTMWHAERAPAASLFTYMSGGLSSMEFIMWLEVGGGNALLEKVMKGFGAHVIPSSGIVTPPETFMYSKKPINKVADLQGIKMRTAGDGGLALAKLGVKVVGIPYPEIYDSMKKGVIDAFEAGDPAYDVTTGVYEVAPYIYLSGSRQPMEWIPFVVREDLWNALPEDLKIIITNLSKQAALLNFYEAAMDEIPAIEKFRKFGCKVSVIAPEIDAAVDKAAEEVYAEKSAKDPLTAEIVKSVFDFKKYVRSGFPRL